MSNATPKKLRYRKEEVTIPFKSGAFLPCPGLVHEPFAIHRGISPKFPEPSRKQSWTVSIYPHNLRVWQYGSLAEAKDCVQQLVTHIPIELFTLDPPFNQPATSLEESNAAVRRIARQLGPHRDKICNICRNVAVRYRKAQREKHNA